MFSILILTRSTTSQTVVLLAPVLMIIVWLLGHLSDRGLLAVLSAAFCAIALPLFVYCACCAVVGSDPWRPLHGVTFTDRLDLWQFLAEEISKRPWLGAGYGSFWAINAAVQPSLQRPTWFSLYAIINEGHDGYLDLLATGGIIGLAGGLFVVFQGVGRAFRAVQSGGAMARPTALFHTAFLLGLLIHNATESNLFSNQASLAVALMLCLLDLNKAHAATSGAAAQLRINRRSATVNAGAR
jgi:O-antigen ligase